MSGTIDSDDATLMAEYHRALDVIRVVGGDVNGNDLLG
jgi:hypothetical protein